MIAIRFLILALVCYAAWYLIRGHRKKKQTPSIPDNDPRPQDVLVEDPVCHLLIPKHQALRLRKNGVTYYFCSEECCDQFVEKTTQGES
ncbi:YHS domain-containing protein [Desulfobulbus oligotrophicus]|jgi:YHS domain-containing protein|uniref:YHS domain-containing protein n=1 Tax=Desulfobulbus oligotrophicus TaxID=1909699 RepID=A0A7T6APX0_9BACT|nr:YHS domain-containing protein [Desulfobulbus oligotrophicus]MDY0390545.1 YHS domain-containing protein [Desulfobulbus oligotrophicus]QQG64835.1 YHS domain-containing protein [Desulfobulbus oligotrophicus]